jgi:hypothetical protein
MNRDVSWESRGESFEVDWMAGDGEISIVCYCRDAQGQYMSILRSYLVSECFNSGISFFPIRT